MFSENLQIHDMTYEIRIYRHHIYTHTHTDRHPRENSQNIGSKSTKTCLLTKISTSNFFTIPIPPLGRR